MIKLGKNDVTDVGNITPWEGWCAIGHCALCGNGPMDVSFEFCYSLNGAPDKYLQECCVKCTRDLIEHDPVYMDKEVWKKSVTDGKNTYGIFLEYGLIDDLGIIPPKNDASPEYK